MRYISYLNGPCCPINNVSKLNKQEDLDPANGHEYVEIGGIKWATMNVGATNETDYGLYFQWGDTQGYTAEQVGSGDGKKAFTWADYKYSNNGGSSAADMTKYNSTDGKTELDIEDDAVRANWGGTWRMPTTDELKALGNAVNAVWTTNYNGSDVNGILCTDKTDDTKKLFFPAAGSANNGSVRNVGGSGYAWSSSLRSGSIALGLYFYFFGSYWSSENGRSIGFSVRGVLDN